MAMTVGFYTLKTIFMHDLNSLRNFQFSYLNPVFWGCLLLLFLILSRFWEIKKAFSFCAVLAIILLATTKLEGHVSGMLSDAGGMLDPSVIRIIAVFVILVIFLCYVTLEM